MQNERILARVDPFSGWRGNFLLAAAEQWLKLELTKNFKVVIFGTISSKYYNLFLQVIRDLDLLPPILGQDWSSVFLQRFDGTVTYVALPTHRSLN